MKVQKVELFVGDGYAAVKVTSQDKSEYTSNPIMIDEKNLTLDVAKNLIDGFLISLKPHAERAS